MGKLNTACLHIFLLLFSTILLIPVCSFTEELDDVTIQLKWFHQFQFAGYYAALEKGFYAEEGLRVKLREPSPPKGVADTVLSGEAQYGVSDATLLLDRMQGKPVVVLKQIFQHSPLVFITKKESSIADPYSMEGKKIMFDPSGDIALVTMLQRTLGGIDNIQQVPMTPGQHVDKLINDEVDGIVAYLANEPFGLARDNIPINVISPESYGVDFYGDNLFTSEEELSQHPERVDKVIRATLKGWKYALDHRDEIINLIIDKYAPELAFEKLAYEADIISRMIRSEAVPLGLVTPQRYDAIAKIYAANSISKNTVDLKSFIYRSPVFGSTDNHGVDAFYGERIETEAESSSRIALNQAEKSWLRKHPVIRFAGSSDWLPQEAFDSDGGYLGIVADILDLLEKRLNVRFDPVVPKNWTDAVEMLEYGTVDMLSGTLSDSRKNVRFTEPHLDFPLLIVGKKNAPYIYDPNQLRGKRIGIVKDRSYISGFRREHPHLNYSELDNVREGLLALSSGKIDCFIGASSTISYLLSELEFTDLQFIGETEASLKLRFAVNSQQQLLLSILNKSIASLSEGEKGAIRQKWVPDVRMSKISVLTSYLNDPVVMLTVVLFILSIASIVMWAVMRTLDNRFFKNSRFAIPKPVGLIVASLLIGVLVVYAWLGVRGMESQERAGSVENLNALLDATQEALVTWVDGEKHHINMYANDLNLLEIVKRLLEVPPNTETLLASNAQSELRKYFHEKQRERETLGFFVIDKNFISLASRRDGNVGSLNLIAEQQPSLIRKAFGGETVFIPPIVSDVPLPDGSSVLLKPGLATMFFAAPIRDLDGRVIAVMTLRYDPENDFTRLSRVGKMGNSGETYAFNKNARLLSRSRFEDSLVKMNKLPEGFSSILNVRLTDPGSDFIKDGRSINPRRKYPLTYMAASAVAGLSGYDLKGYRDYRGVRVIGTWRWDTDLNIGLAAKIDEVEVLVTYHANRRIVFSVLWLTVVLAALFFGFVLWNGQRTKRVLVQARDDWALLAEERLSELKVESERLELATQAANVGIWDLDVTANNLIWDDLMYDLYGLEKEHVGLVYDSWQQAVHPDDLEIAEQELQMALQGDAEFDTEFRVVLPDGNVRYVRAIAIVIRNQDGRAVRVIGVNWDISEQKRIESELRKLSIATELSPASIIITNPEGEIEYVNHKFIETTGYTTDEVLGLTPRILKSDLQSESIAKELWEVITSGRVWRGEFLNRNKSGETYWESAAISPIRDDEGNIIHYLGVQEDITKRKQTEAELAERAVDLKQSNEALVTAKQAAEIALIEAETANRSKSDFLANMSHEIRTPMNAVIGMTHLVLGTDLTERQQDYLQKIGSSAKSLLTIISDILDFSKIEAGKLTIDSTTFNLTDVISDVVNLSVSKIADKGIELIVDVDKNVPTVLIGDPVRVSQVFNNLLSNAAKFTEEGENEITIKLLELGTENLTLECVFSDTGIGMSPAQAEKLFQKFSQADTSITRKYGGTGLGLAICKQLVELMGGSIRVESTLGQGSAFTFTLQLKYQVDRRQEKTSLILPQNLRNLRVLLLDDNTKSVVNLKGQLESLSFDVDTTEDWKEAYTFLKQASAVKSPIELIVAAWSSGKRMVVEIDRQVRSSGLSQIPTILMPSVNDILDAEEFVKNRDMYTVAQKPITPSALYNVVVDLFGYNNLKIKKRHVFGQSTLTDLETVQGGAVLLVEDNLINQQVASELLDKAQVVVTIAKDGKEALEFVKNQEFDLVLMDIQMPVMDGLTATRKIRSLNTDAKNIPIVAMTANAMAGDRQKSLDAGMNDHITKPIDPEELYTCLGLWMRPEGWVPLVGDGAQSGCENVELPVFIPGIDQESGIERVGGNRQLYLTILREFLVENESFAEHMVEALEIKDVETGLRLIHTLKGVSGTIGATALHEAAYALEKAIKQQSAGQEELLRDTLKSLEGVMAGLGSALPSAIQPNTVAPTDDEIDHETVDSGLHKLKELLDLRDMDAEDLFRELQASLSIVYPEYVAQLDKALETLDFKLALEIVDEIENSSSGGK